jgi:hypothetical protein
MTYALRIAAYVAGLKSRIYPNPPDIRHRFAS